MLPKSPPQPTQNVPQILPQTFQNGVKKGQAITPHGALWQCLARFYIHFVSFGAPFWRHGLFRGAFGPPRCKHRLHVYGPWGPFKSLWVTFGRLLGSMWDPFGSIWNALGSIHDPLDDLWGALGHVFVDSRGSFFTFVVSFLKKCS